MSTIPGMQATLEVPATYSPDEIIGELNGYLDGFDQMCPVTEDDVTYVGDDMDGHYLINVRSMREHGESQPEDLQELFYFEGERSPKVQRELLKRLENDTSNT